jgi:RNA polymerase sigma-70 factor (ECF subfamily)
MIWTAGSSDDVAGSQALAEELVSHVTSLRRYALLLVGNGSDADDAVQEALTRVLARARGWGAIDDLRAYLFSTLHNVFIDSTRRAKRMPSDFLSEDVLASLITPADQHKRLELRDTLLALAKLPVEQREVVLLVGLEGLSYQDTAKALDIPVGTVMSRLSRGREALRAMTNRDSSRKLRVVK